jgi:glucose-6-phosphate 1-epimerase
MSITSPVKSNQGIDFINQSFSNDNVEFIQFAPGLIKARLRFSKHAYAEVHLQGAHLTRWMDTAGRDNIFNSSTAVYKSGVPIRGGNPIIFPQFGPGEMCQHGFARNSVWRVVGTETTAASTVLCLELRPEDVEEHYLNQWQHDFVLTVTISLGETLVTKMKVQNLNSYPLAFTQGFHTYLALDDINSVEINGLSGLYYMDNLRDRAIFHEEHELVFISDFIDRRYQAIPAEMTITDKSTGRTLAMQTKNCQDAFVWNPWAEAEKKLLDLAAQSHQKFVCVEPGNMKSAVILAAGQDFMIEQEIKRVD